MDKNFSYYLSKFLKDYIVIERNLSNNTIRSYKKTFSLLIEYLVNVKNIKLANINFSTVTLDYIIDFLNYLEQEIKDLLQLNHFINIVQLKKLVT